jgi:predicted transcriptional regulator
MTEKTTTQKKENLGSMSLRVDRDLLKAFQTIAKENNRNASMLLRDYMANYVKKHGQGDLFK